MVYIKCIKCNAEFEARYTPERISYCGFCTPTGKSCCRKKARPPKDKKPTSKIT